ncbi:MAG TPA: transaldolase [Anaeromyxobacter sp.]
MANPLRELGRYGQSVWYDSLRRAILVSGELKRYVEDDGLTGLTTNPAIYEKAIGGSRDYDAELAGLLPRRDLDAKAIYEELAIHDIQAAADLLRPVYERTGRKDGYVSLEVSPVVAHDAEATIAEARRLWRTLRRENVMIKVPGTEEALPAIRALLAEGVNVNVTLLFSRAAWARVAGAHLAGLEERAARGDDVSRLGSVASFFVSRIDSLVDKRLDELGAAAKDPALRKRAEALRGRTAIANAKLAYQEWQALVSSPRWLKLEKLGARTQRLLWASTSTKDPRYRDVMYVEALVGPDTVDTMPPATFEAFRDHGRVRPTLEEGVEGARQALSDLEELGISLDEATDRLLVEGVRLFSEPFAKLLAVIEGRRAQAPGAGAGAPPGS